MSLKSILTDIGAETMNAINVHPNWPKNEFERLAIMQEEAGEVTKALVDLRLNGKGDLHEVKSEIIQTAAMCVRMLIAYEEDQMRNEMDDLPF